MTDKLGNEIYKTVTDLRASETIYENNKKNYQKFLKVGLASVGVSALMLPVAGVLVSLPIGVAALGAIGVLKLKEFGSGKKVEELTERMKKLRDMRLQQQYGKEMEKTMVDMNNKMKRGF